MSTRSKEMITYFDNSPENPRNPSRPPVDGYWGVRAVDEMMFLPLLYIYDDDPRPGSSDK